MLRNYQPRLYGSIPRVGVEFDLFKEPLTNSDLRTGLREFVSKNKKLPEFFLELDQSSSSVHPDVAAVVDAIKNADVDAEIFLHPDADKYILYVIEKELVSFWPGLSAYTYTTTLAQFTDKRDLKEQDADVKSIRNLKTTPMFEDGQMTVEGCEFFDCVHMFLMSIGVKFDFSKLRNAFQNMDPFDQQLTEIDLHDFDEGVDPEDRADDYGVNRLLYVMSYNMPFCVKPDRKHFIIPSFGMMNVVLQQIEKSPIQMKPIFGTVGEQTRDKLHGWDQHPVALYSNSVSSNITHVHSLRGGPIPNMLHDMGHALWATMLGYQHRRFLNRELFPYLRERNAGNDQVIAHLIESFGDYDLSPLNKYYSKDTRCRAMLQNWATKVHGGHDSVDADNAYIKILLPALESWMDVNPNHRFYNDIGGLHARATIHVSKRLKKMEEQRALAEIRRRLAANKDAKPTVAGPKF